MGDIFVPLENVVLAIRGKGLDVSIKNGLLYVVKNESPEKLDLPSKVGRKMLFRLGARYDIPMHWFWNPEMIPGAKPPTVN